MNIVKESAPHLRRKADVKKMMLDVLIALTPTLIFSFIVYPINTLITFSISSFIMISSEFFYLLIRKTLNKFSINNILTPLISSIIFTLIMPAGAPIYAVIVGSLFGIVLGKLVFGGLGSNIFNPAALGMVFAKLCFGSQYVSYVDTWYYANNDVIASGTPLGIINDGYFANIDKYQLFDLFFGRIPGTLGEVYKITIIVGLIYLLIVRSIDYRVVLSYLGTFTFTIFIAGLTIFALDNSVNPFIFTIYNLLSGGVLFGATFMITDPVTSPISSPSRIIYGMIAAILTVFIRLFAALPEGVGFSILIANMIAPLLDYLEGGNSSYSLKKIITMISIITVSSLIIFLVIYFGGIYHV